ncbi:hypothetical protein FB451DRAFT_1560698 [Mycena latifolia]|nr:hypothetical protein FB451DRAFT_1560698 [Mycena latifolia]
MHKRECQATTAAADVSDTPSSAAPPPGNTIHEDSVSLGLDPALISGARLRCGAQRGPVLRAKRRLGLFWLLDPLVMEKWEVEAQESNTKSRSFRVTTSTPISTGPEWVDVVLDTALNLRMNDPTKQDELYASILAGLFPHLAAFTPAQNTALLDIFTNPVWCPDGAEFRVGTATAIFCGHGQPSGDLITQLLGRCMGWMAPPYGPVDTLLEYVALPIQRHWPDIAGTRILDTALFAFLTTAGRFPVPVDKIFQIAETSPAACKHLLLAVTTMSLKAQIADPGIALLGLFEPFGVTLAREGRHEPLIWLVFHCRHDSAKKERLQKFLNQRSKGAPSPIEAKEYTQEEIMQQLLTALEHPLFPIM